MAVMAKYPPCISCGCTGNTCKAPGDPFRYEWPELVGLDIVSAKATIERTNPSVIVIVLDAHCGQTMDVCCNRVFLCPDASGRVRLTPMLGKRRGWKRCCCSHDGH
ncbi:hypothetical protein A4A49_27061 [Nicotiana attenuata]|uniref:Uncharacterized protein n=1 Tax=Nicotiana attenuata TaxID=49451 RepID=A0A1J6IWL7_NICAT|nr:hypothetical protein A4A49_27061 [Nicotiana attenuata]